MGRRSGFSGFVNAVARAAREAEAARRRHEREQIRSLRAQERYAAQSAKEAKQRYLEDRAAEVEEKNEELRIRIEELEGVLAATLGVDDCITFESLRVAETFRPFVVPAHLQEDLTPPNEETYSGKLKPPKGLLRLFPGAEGRYERARLEALARFEADLKAFKGRLAARETETRALSDKYESEKATFLASASAKNAEVDEFERSYEEGEPSAVTTYFSMVLERSSYPDGFPREFRVAYVPDCRQLVIEYELPPPNVVPAVAEYRYVKTKDLIEEKQRKAAEVKERYQDIVAAVALRTIHEVLEADRGRRLDVVAFNGFVNTVDPATGRDIRPCLISVRTTAERFAEVDLARADKRVCLRNLGAQVSPRASEAQPVKPIIEFDMVDKRFVEESDVLSDLESRPNLMDLNPFEFENLVANLFQKMGLETRLTRSTKDGGVDAVAFDPRPVLGGKVVIQAKRYRNTVGVSAVRDLYGTMMNEGANKGILVSTSGYGPDAFEFAKDKPIELLDGSALLYLLQQVGVEARIVFPAESGDPST